MAAAPRIDEPRIELVLRLNREHDPITGTIEPRHGDQHPFTGYLELMSVLETLRRPPNPADTAPAAGPCESTEETP